MKKLILMIVLVALIATGCSEKNEPEQNNEDSNTNYEQTNNDAIIAPDFELETLDGTKIKLSEMRDKYVILNFWATWCGYCVIEMPDLQKLQEAHKDDLLVLTVNVGESKEVVQKFMEENNLDLTVVLDEKMNVANTYGIRSYPTSISVNKKGEAIRGYVGMLTYEQMEQLYSFFEE
ncbi:MAG: TlpA family protein disulfide reductase [Sedimentibacter sp.]